MTVHPEIHPDANALAAFVDGGLEGETLREVAAHLNACRDCLEVVGDAAAIAREGAPVATVVTVRSRWLPLAAAAVLVVAASLAGWVAWTQWASDPAEPLLAALGSMPERPIEARISGAVHAPYVVLRSERLEAEPSRLRLAAAAGSVLESSAGLDDAPNQHAAGVAALLAGDPARAVVHLERAARLDGSRPRYWSDLAAARYEAAQGAGGRRLLPLALAAADRALASSPGDAAALFNRALILEALGRTDEARAAWERVPRAEEGTRWAAEAAQRGKALRTQPK